MQRLDSWNQKTTFTKAINAGTSTNGPITPAKACPLLIKYAYGNCDSNSKLFPVAVKAIAVLLE
jgi:hypothetical protein